MLKINVGLSRKVSQDFQSKGFSLNIEGELTDGPMIVTQYHHADAISSTIRSEARMPKPNEILELARTSLLCTAMIPQGEVHINLMRLWRGGKFAYAKIGGTRM